MKKWSLLAILGLAVALIVSVAATSAFARGGGGNSQATPQAATSTSSDNATSPYGWMSNMMDDMFGGNGTGAGYGMMGGYMGLGNQVTMQHVATVLGITYDQLTTRMNNGETIAQIAQAQGVDTSKVVDAIMAPGSEMMQIAVKYGYMTDAQAQTILDQARTTVGQALTTTGSNYGYGYCGPGVTGTGPATGNNNASGSTPQNGTGSNTTAPGYGYGPGGMMGGLR